MEYKDKIKKNKAIIIRMNKVQGFILSIFASLNILWLLVQIIDYFFLTDVLKNCMFIGSLIIIFSFIIPGVIELEEYWKRKVLKRTFHDSLSSLDEKIEVYKKIIDRCIFNIDDDILLKCILVEKEEKNWEEVICIGKISSELYWRISRYKLRIKNGEIMLDAIRNIQNDDENENMQLLKAKILIDDIGYTLAELDIQHYAEKARENIEEGLSIAKCKSDYFLISKAYRHLAGTYLKEIRLMTGQDVLIQDKINCCVKYYEMACEESNKITDNYEKKRMKAFLKYLHGNILYVQGSWFDAWEEYILSKKQFERIKDFGSAVKIYYRIGNVYEKQKVKSKAINTYIDGFNESQKLERNDQVMKNGLAICQLVKGNNEKMYEYYYIQVSKLAKEFANQQVIAELDKINNS
ncbi:MAG: hypothetical protein NC543_03185 [bacterium]|nr:hypothetical protein [bacterium]MCM1373940.1 hypothetical protein [Muribaculum sp.]